MPESVLTLLKFCLVAVLYLFFLRVLRAVWAEVRQPAAPAPAPTPASVPAPVPQAARAAARPAGPLGRPAVAPIPTAPPGRPGWLRVVRPPAMAGTSFQVADEEATVGRAPGSTILLDDPTVSSRHARLSRQGQTLVVDDLGSRNGTLVNGRRITAPTRLSSGDRLCVGPNVELEVLP